MGSLLVVHTPDGDQWLDDHEGYVAKILDDGSTTSTWTLEIEQRIVGWRAECSCGWFGPLVDSGEPREPSEDEHDEIMEMWHERHADPLAAELELTGSIEELGRQAAEADRQAAEADRRLRAAVGRARLRGATWEQIGRALGVTKQAAHDRFAKTIR